MKRKDFIKTSSVLFAGSLLSPYLACSPQNTTKEDLQEIVRKNWAGNYTYQAKKLYEPTSVEELQNLIKSINKQKALGSRHCFNNIADSPENQISTKNLNQIVSLDEENKTLTVEAGARYGNFSEELYQKGYALHNLASLPHITVAGACATATHGSGVNNGNLATSVVAIELIKPSGELAKIDRNHPDFPAVVVGLGAFGIISKVTLEIQNAFDVRQDVFQDLPLSSVENSFDEIMSSGYSVSLFTDWMDKKVSEVWIKRRMDTNPQELGDDFYGAKAATKDLHPIVELSAEACSAQMGVPGPWYDRLPHFKMGFTPSAGEELQSEYFIPKEHAVAAIMAVEKLKEEINPHLMITEIRTIAADSFWMSPCYQQDSIAIHFTWKPKTKEVMETLPKIEEVLAPFGVKPHWGKLFTISPALLHVLYEKFPEFLALANSYDPEGKFRNSYLDLNIYKM
ncbi:FAD-binding protein [Algoriphagus lutimaris]|uniref:D-arabinono-1,4-lactone oxidase n=1 Tax=Algoriphagus lutimaris TaxID=613197 RepID=UPI00196A733D|nr:D-arabinono-1,4-lactone oxidase [Algoriphagus lutimaris]MBN3521079.1 FAD-binding protein [Algoriphagus lutimaris]